ncbi:hypothetical protein SAMN04515674_12058 [Pseudarcicella hirudinis]|uniref:Lipoprotein n=1 Tax=Pseudarcicella hirudinis TaxID=1079859 RepID=A0A1I5YPV4_9BACT|nr:hypothetical protein [Pseudarcicella hirudinis]SFQ46120.1 hypothetical protein SAMN04515674_12058 [Pseudarcicella hirudinis]
MKTNKLKFISFCVTLALLSLNGCSTKDVETVPAYNYTFDQFKDIKLPDVTPTAPATVTSTNGSVSASPAASAANDGLASGNLTAAVSAVAGDVAKAVSSDDAKKLSDQFTPSVLSSLTSGGALPAGLASDVSKLASDPSLAAYLPTSTLPTVNGKAVGGRTGAPEAAPVVISNFAAADDECKAAAQKAFDAAKATLDAAKNTQTAAVTATYNQRVTTINASNATCKGSVPATFAALRTAAKAAADKSLAGLSTLLSSGKINQSTYNILSVFIYVNLAVTIQAINALEKAETSACDARQTAELAAAAAARDADLAKINASYNAVLADATAKLNAATASCHNQGSGK